MSEEVKSEQSSDGSDLPVRECTCAPGVCEHPERGCKGTRVLDYRMIPMEGFGEPKVPCMQDPAPQ